MFDYEIIENVGIIAEYSKGWRREVNIISWNGSEPKYDIRDWSPDHDRMSKGITLSYDEMDAFLNVMSGRGAEEVEEEAPDYTIAGISADGRPVVIAECYHKTLEY